MGPNSAVELLAQLIARPSVNPHLAASGDPHAGESRVAAWLCDYFDFRRWPWLAQEVHPGRANVAAVVAGGRGDVLLWEAHQDTVAAAGMEQPFAARHRDGRIYGRGACDVKGGLAAMLAALAAAQDAPMADRPTIVLASTVNEECGFTGVRGLMQLWGETPEAERFSIGGPLSIEELQVLRPRAAIVAEPTSLQVVGAHRGVVRWQARMIGRAAHSSRPESGANAVYAMARVVQAIEQIHREMRESFDPAALELAGECGPPTVCVTTFHGGAGPNTVPDSAVIDIDRRVAPSENADAAYSRLIADVAGRVDLGGCRLEHAPPWMQSRGLAGGPSEAWARRLAAAIESCGVASRVMGVPYGTNAATIAAAGIPAAVFGPGSIDQAHTIDESIEIAELNRAVDVLTAIASGKVDV